MNSKTNRGDDASDREIVLSRVFHASRELVWEAWTNPAQIVKWWGPRGFSTTIKRMDFRVGGEWTHTMHGPDGTNYPNKSIFKEIVPLERITYSHGGGRENGDGPGATFTATWTFESEGPEKTRLTLRMVFPSKEARDTVVRAYGAVEGGKQTLERLGDQLGLMQSIPFIIEREFDAPRDLVWRAWTERDHFARWFGPKGVEITLAKFDLRPDGLTHYSMTMPTGVVVWGRAVYREIVAPLKLVWVNSFSGKDGGVTRHPFSKDPWPLQMLTTVTLAERGNKTLVTVHWVPIDANEAERRTFEAGRPSMNGGWGGTFDQLAAYLAQG